MMRRRNEIISVGVSIAIATAMFAQLLSIKPPTARELRDNSEPPPMVAPKPINLSAISLPAPPPALAPPKITTPPTTVSETVTPLRRTPEEVPKLAGTIKKVEPLTKQKEPNIKEISTLNVEPIKPTTRVAKVAAKSVIPLQKPKETSPMSLPVPVKPAHKAQPQTVGLTNTTPLMVGGRPLLRLLEHGDGPSIDIAWPQNARGREALFQSFAQCFGMLVALMDPNGTLYSELNPSGQWHINRDRYSGFVRQSGEFSTTGERVWSRRILDRHPQAAGSVTIRIFPRAVDALLIGGLAHLLGNGYRATKSIEARYVQTRNAILIDDILADGLPVAGRIDLTAAGLRHCRANAKHKGV